MFDSDSDTYPLLRNVIVAAMWFVRVGECAQGEALEHVEKYAEL
jgi:hypothetical protein